LIARTAQADGIEVRPSPKLTPVQLTSIERTLYGRTNKKLPEALAKRIQLIARRYLSAREVDYPSEHDLQKGRAALKTYVDYLRDVLQTSDELFQVLSEPQNSSFQVLDDKGLEYTSQIQEACAERLHALSRLSEELLFRLKPNKGGSPAPEKQEAIRICIIKLLGVYESAKSKPPTYTYDSETEHMKSPFFDFVWAFFKQVDKEIYPDYLFTVIRSIVKNQN
jgi:hypothetical protein